MQPQFQYTRFVQLTKLLLGILVFVLIALMFLYPVIKKNSDVHVAFMALEKTVKPPPTEMKKPIFHGFDENNQPYNINADNALQVDEDNVQFDKVSGDLTTSSGVWLSIQADKGSMKMKEKLLYLNGSVEMFDDEGYELRTDHMDIDIGKKIATTRDPVNGQGPSGTLKSNGAVFYGNTKSAVFGGPVFVTIYLPPKSPVKKETR
jgi:lipopolysaccharide export system protein LptC